MNDQDLLEQLLNRQESNELDFKSQQYNLKDNYPCSRFIKDIVAMANTPRSEAAYIVLGVREESGKPTGVPGVDQHPDESDLGRIVGGKVTPTPQFAYRQVAYQGLELGLIEIPCEQPGVVVPRLDFGVLRRNAVYIRRNSQNIEAEPDDLARMFRTTRSESPAQDSQPTGNWEQLYRACDGFDHRRTYIVILDTMPDSDARDWATIGQIDWSIVVDFDTHTDISGSYFAAKTALGDRRALHLTALDDSPSITARSTTWVAAAGLSSRPTTEPTSNWRDWNRHKAPYLERVMDDLAKITEPGPVTLLVLGGEPAIVSTTCEVIDRTFTDRIDYVFATPRVELYSDIVKRFDASAIPITFSTICQGLREALPRAEPSREILVPQLGGGTVALVADREHWLSEQLELVHWDIESTDDTYTSDDSFLKGATVSWNDLIRNVDVARDVTPQLEQLVLKELADRATRRITFRHWPGAGATTVVRRIAWNIHRQFSTVVALEIHPQETAERLQYLFGITRMPILVVIDLPNVPKEVIDRFYDTLRSSHIPAVLFTVERQFGNEHGGRINYLDAMLTTREAVRLSEVLSARVPDRRSDLIALIDDSDRRRRTPFYFGLAAYGRDFQGLEAYVSTRLSNTSHAVRSAMLITAFAYYYGQIPVSLQTFGPIVGIGPSKLIALSGILPDYVRELLVEHNGVVRPAHYIIAEEILQQELQQSAGSRSNWRIGLADLAITFIDLLSGLPHRTRGKLSEVLRAVLIERGRNQAPDGPWEADFSRFLEDVPSEEGRERVLKYLTECFPEEPHFWAHLGRFYSRRLRDHAKAHSAHDKALVLKFDDSLLHHMAGMAWRDDLYDSLAGSVKDITLDHEIELFDKLGEAKKQFELARQLDSRSEYNYISHVQMIVRAVGRVSAARGQRYDPLRFLTTTGNDKYRELVDEAQNLLSDLALIKGDEVPSQLQVRLQADLDALYGRPNEAIQRLTNILDQKKSYGPPLRRAIIRTYVARRQGDWSGLSDQELSRVVQLAQDNITEEPESDYNLRLWLRAVRTENALGVDRVAEQLAYKRLRNPSGDTTYYLYIMKFLQLETGDLSAKDQVSRLIDDCVRETRTLSRTSSSFEWLGSEAGLAGIVHVSTLGLWDEEEKFWSNIGALKRLRGHIASIRNQGNGEIELPSGLRAFFTPSRGAVQGGYLAGQDIGREVEFYLAFTYDGLRAWSVGNPKTG